MIVATYGYARESIVGEDKIRRFSGEQGEAYGFSSYDPSNGEETAPSWVEVRIEGKLYQVHRKQCRKIEHIRQETEL